MSGGMLCCLLGQATRSGRGIGSLKLEFVGVAMIG